MFPNKPEWSLVYLKRIKNQNDKKLADFHFKLLHKILPNQESMYHWKISLSSKCRFGCSTIENQSHQFIECSRLQQLHRFVERMFNSLKLNIKMTYKTLLFGYKISYPAYDTVNILVAQIFYAICKYWLKNDGFLCIKRWVYSHIQNLQLMNEHSKDKQLYKLISEFQSKWRDLDNS